MSNSRQEEPSQRTGPWAGYESIDDAIEGLRRARFRVASCYDVTGRGLVVDGMVLEGTIAAGMVLLAPAERFPNILVELRIQAIEEVMRSEGQRAVALVLGEVPADAGEPTRRDDSVLDVLERSPAA